MDAGLSELRDDIRCKTLHNRSLEALIQTDKFERLWDDSTKEEREKVKVLVGFGYRSKVVEWMKTHRTLELGEQSLGILRERGRALKVKNYSRLSKAELIMAIKEEENATDKGRNGN